jgi:glucose/arabinose dehydrogenase
MMKTIFSFFSALILMALTACGTDTSSLKLEVPVQPGGETGGLQLPAGFKATIVATKLGKARHIAINSNGDIYVKLERLKDGKGILRLRDTNGDGIADEQIAFGDYTGTGIAIKNGYLYASSNTTVYRYKLSASNDIEQPDKPEVIVKDLVDRRQHASKSITLDDAGNLYVNIGAFSNACQEQDRTKGSKGQDPCPILEIAGGIWQFRADVPNQSYKEGVRYATGLRNVVGLDWNSSVNALYVTQHGRDQLESMYPDQYTDSISAELPAEEFFRVEKGMNFGWPYCYYDPFQKQKVLAPEYGGDGKTIGRCSDMQQPLFAFPAHWAPNALLFYSGSAFPEQYRNGAFIAFHGSWNRAPFEQGGYNVVFLPMKDGKPAGDFSVFADGFAGADKSPRGAAHRPCGLTMGTDGSMYISDDQSGTIWKVYYQN